MYHLSPIKVYIYPFSQHTLPLPSSIFFRCFSRFLRYKTRSPRFHGSLVQEPQSRKSHNCAKTGEGKVLRRWWAPVVPTLALTERGRGRNRNGTGFRRRPKVKWPLPNVRRSFGADFAFSIFLCVNPGVTKILTGIFTDSSCLSDRWWKFSEHVQIYVSRSRFKVPSRQFRVRAPIILQWGSRFSHTCEDFYIFIL